MRGTNIYGEEVLIAELTPRFLTRCQFFALCVCVNHAKNIDPMYQKLTQCFFCIVLFQMMSKFDVVINFFDPVLESNRFTLIR